MEIAQMPKGTCSSLFLESLSFGQRWLHGQATMQLHRGPFHFRKAPHFA